jgi:hypothetical protein
MRMEFLPVSKTYYLDILLRDKAADGETLSTRIFRSTLRSSRLSTLLGLALGFSFTVCFATGLLSHLIQHPVDWLEWPARPVSLYRWITATHTMTGIASVPLLLTKLWSVYPMLWERPAAYDIWYALQRLSLVPLVGGALFLMTGGLADHFYWYKNPKFFTPTHYWLAWITVGALLIHVGVKLEVTRKELGQKVLSHD